MLGKFNFVKKKEGKLFYRVILSGLFSEIAQLVIQKRRKIKFPRLENVCFFDIQRISLDIATYSHDTLKIFTRKPHSTRNVLLMRNYF